MWDTHVYKPHPHLFFHQLRSLHGQLNVGGHKGPLFRLQLLQTSMRMRCRQCRAHTNLKQVVVNTQANCTHLQGLESDRRTDEEHYSARCNWILGRRGGGGGG